MARSIVISVIFFSISLFAQDRKISTAVLDLEPVGVSLLESQALSDRLRHELNNTGLFTVIEQAKMKQFMKAQNLENNCINYSCALQLGQKINVRTICFGSIRSVGALYSITVQMIDVKTGRNIRMATYDHSGNIESLMIFGMKIIARRLAGKKEYEAKKTFKATDKTSNFGLSINVTPFLLSGYHGSFWIGLSPSLRIRPAFYQLNVPNAYWKEGFINGKINNSYALFVDLYSSQTYSGWGLTNGLEYHKNSIEHSNETDIAYFNSIIYTLGVGYAFKLSNHINFNTQLITQFLVIGDRKIRLGEYTTSLDFVSPALSLELDIRF